MTKIAGNYWSFYLVGLAAVVDDEIADDLAEDVDFGEIHRTLIKGAALREAVLAACGGFLGSRLEDAHKRWTRTIEANGRVDLATLRLFALAVTRARAANELRGRIDIAGGDVNAAWKAWEAGFTDAVVALATDVALSDLQEGDDEEEDKDDGEEEDKDDEEEDDEEEDDETL